MQQANFGEARDTYVEYFLKLITPAIFDGLVSIYVAAVQESNGQDVLKHFQRLLKDIKHWNSLQIDAAVNKITSDTEYFGELITAIIVCNVKILSSVKLTSSEDTKVSLKVPKVSEVVHKLYLKCAKDFYEEPTDLTVPVSSS